MGETDAAERAATDAIRNYAAFIRAVQRGDQRLAFGHRRAAIESELELLFTVGAALVDKSA